jgi:hypothetical protein
MVGRRARELVIALLAALAGLSGGAASAVTTPADVAATRTYVAADYALVQTGSSHIPVARAELHRLAAKLRRACAGAAANSPQNPESTELSNEVIGAMVTTANRSNIPQMDRFVAAAAPLRWSNRSLTRVIRGYVGQLRTMAALAVPDLCGDVRAWAASGYRALPASTIRFGARFMPAWVALGELPGSLTSYERPEDRGLVTRSVQDEVRISDFEAEAVETYSEIMNEIGINP